MLFQKRGELDKAEEICKISLDIERQDGHLAGQALCCVELALINEQKDKANTEALDYWQEAKRLFERMGIKNDIKRLRGLFNR